MVSELFTNTTLDGATTIKFMKNFSHKIKSYSPSENIPIPPKDFLFKKINCYKITFSTE